MEDTKVIFASNLIKLRNAAGLTQAELAEKINYSDKSISKWERAEAMPDLSVAKSLASLFGVTVDFMVNSHDDWKPKEDERKFSTTMVTLVSIIGIWTLALLLFVIFWILGSAIWMFFIAAIPVSLITLLVLNSVWNKKRLNVLIIALLVLSIFFLIYMALLKYNPWQILLVAVPAELVVYLSSRIKKRAND